MNLALTQRLIDSIKSLGFRDVTAEDTRYGLQGVSLPAVRRTSDFIDEFFEFDNKELDNPIVYTIIFENGLEDSCELKWTGLRAIAQVSVGFIVDRLKDMIETQAFFLGFITSEELIEAIMRKTLSVPDLSFSHA